MRPAGGWVRGHIGRGTAHLPSTHGPGTRTIDSVTAPAYAEVSTGRTYGRTHDWFRWRGRCPRGDGRAGGISKIIRHRREAATPRLGDADAFEGNLLVPPADGRDGGSGGHGSASHRGRFGGFGGHGHGGGHSGHGHSGHGHGGFGGHDAGGGAAEGTTSRSEPARLRLRPFGGAIVRELGARACCRAPIRGPGLARPRPAGLTVTYPPDPSATTPLRMRPA